MDENSTFTLQDTHQSPPFLNSPKITVITPSFQQGRYIEATICSVLDQGYENLEFMVIDGGSTDGTIDIIKKYEGQLHYWESKPDKGQSEAINKGLARATGNIITWLNSDDRLAEGALERVSKLFSPEIGLVYGDTQVVMNNGKSWTNKAAKEDFSAQMIGGMPFAQPSCFFNGDLIREHDLRVDESLHFGMDYYFFLQIFCLSDAVYAPGLMSHYLFHPQSKSSLENGKFADEWARIYASFLHEMGMKNTYEVRDFMKQGLDILPFRIKKNFSESDTQNSYFHFLNNQMKFRYENLELGMTRKLLKKIQEDFPEEFSTNGYRKIKLRTYLPKSVIRSFRNKQINS
jgi:glycosyltransferase involved in cell wall biosynthesis